MRRVRTREMLRVMAIAVILVLITQSLAYGSSIKPSPAAPDDDLPWRRTIIDPGSAGVHAGHYPSLVLNAQGLPSISYFQANLGVLRFTDWNSLRGWLSVDVDSGLGAAADEQHSSLALNSAGKPHIVYRDQDRRVLKHAYRDAGGAWHTEDADATGNTGIDATLKIAPGTDTLQVSYGTGGPGGHGLKYATWTQDSGWISVTLASGADIGEYAALALDPVSGLPHILFNATPDSGELRHIWCTSTPCTVAANWHAAQIVDSGDGVAWFPSAAVDGAHNVHVAYYDFDMMILRYATIAPGGAITLQTVDSAGDAGQHNSLALTSQGDPAVSYYSADAGDLKYAVKVAGTWVVYTSDPLDDTGYYTSLALDSDDLPQIAYHNNGSYGQLKYTGLDEVGHTFPGTDPQFHLYLPLVQRTP